MQTNTIIDSVLRNTIASRPRQSNEFSMSKDKHLRAKDKFGCRFAITSNQCKAQTRMPVASKKVFIDQWRDRSDPYGTIIDNIETLFYEPSLATL